MSVMDEPTPTNQEMLAMNLEELGAWFRIHDKITMNEVYGENRVTVKNEYQKKPIPEDIRWSVWERDNFTCKHCGSRRRLTIDHVYPEKLGGEATIDNCQTLCKSCNSRKGAR